MTLQEAIIKCMNTARSLEKGYLLPEGAENDFKHHLNNFAQSQVEKATSELVEAVKRVLPLAMELRSIVSISNRESKQIQFAENALRRATLKQHKDKFTSFDGTDQSFITGLEEHNPPEL